MELSRNRTLVVDPLTTVRLFKGHNNLLREIAERRGLNKADLIRQAVKEYLDKHFVAGS